MKMIHKYISALLAALFGLGLLQSAAMVPQADTYFDDGDYRYAVNYDDTLSVAAYFGAQTDLVLPERVGDRLVTGIHARCFENSDLTSVVIPRDYTLIDAYAFSNSQQLTKVALPLSLSSIGMMAFRGCTSLEQIDFSVSAELAEIGMSAFFGCKSLTEVRLSNSVNTLGSNAFGGCESLSKVTLPSSLKTVPARAFYGCAIEALAIPDSVTAIGDVAFAENTHLTTVDFPVTLETIGAKAFYNDSFLQGVMLPDSVTQIGTDAFAPMTDSAAFRADCFSSAAAAYFEETAADLHVYEKLLGDVNLDGAVNVIDATDIQRYLIEEPVFSGKIMLDIADANRDGEVDVADATQVQRIAAGYVDE